MKSIEPSDLPGEIRTGWCGFVSRLESGWNHAAATRAAATRAAAIRAAAIRAAATRAPSRFSFRLLAFGLLGLSVWSGCSQEPQFRENRLEWVKIEKASSLPEGEHFDPIHHRDVADIVTAWFGTPDVPFFPMIEGEDDPANELVSLENLEAAAGAVSSDRNNQHRGLYREHCAHCHGITGDGAGPTASFLDPYPRDFRLGKFKFKATPTGTPPTRADLKRILINGVPGTAMPSFRLLSDEELESLIDYVIYLSTRGMTEKLMIGSVRELGEDLPRMVSLPAAKRISEIMNPQGNGDTRSKLGNTAPGDTAPGDTAPGDTAPGDSDSSANDVQAAKELDESEDEEEAREIPVPETFDSELVVDELSYIVEDFYYPVLEKWLSMLDFESDLPDAPEWMDNPAHEEYESKVVLGQSLYFGQANCKQCHGETGVGDGQTNNYDDWTNDWLKVESLNPQDLDSLRDYLQAGAFPPRPIMPRNLRMGVYRGGSEPSDLYLRIKNGIEGTPMPASLTLSDDEVWALVAYVRQMPYESISKPATSTKATNDKTIR